MRISYLCYSALFLMMILYNSLWCQGNTSITFYVNTETIKNTSEDEKIHLDIRGSVAPLSWTKGTVLKDLDNDGVYTASIAFDIKERTDIYIKYVLNGFEWEAGDARKISIEPTHNKEFFDDFKYVQRPENPFKKFVGKWTLKNDLWEQGDGRDAIEQLKIPGHTTICKEINTDTSLLCTIEATSAKGHILWGYDHQSEKIHHLSSFLPFRNGVGEGTVSDNGNIQIKISFGEPEGSYRVYNYTWINDDEYILESNQYDKNDQSTGNFYGGIFTRILDRFNSSKLKIDAKDEEKVKKILQTLDDTTMSTEDKLSIWSDELTHMAPNNKVITSKGELKKYLEEEEGNGKVSMTHKIIELTSYEEIVIVRGKVTGTFTSRNTNIKTSFKTKNLFVFKREPNSSLKIWKVIYNHSPIK